MSAADAFTRATITALSASVRVTGPLADLMYRVFPSTLSMVPATRWVCCCADAVETANTAVKAAAATILIVIMSHLPNGDTPASIQRSAGIAKEAERGACAFPKSPPARPRPAFAYRPRFRVRRRSAAVLGPLRPSAEASPGRMSRTSPHQFTGGKAGRQPG